MIKQTIIAMTLVVLLASSIAGCTRRPTTATAVVTQVSGEVLVLKAGTTVWSSLSAGVNVQLGDGIATKTNASALITFFEGSTVELSSDTEVVVSELMIARETGSTTIKIRQELGRTRSRIEKLAAPASRYEVETPSGVASVRGSVMDVWVLSPVFTIVDAIVDNCWLYSKGVEILLKQGSRGFMVFGQPPTLSPPPFPTTMPTLPTPPTPGAPPSPPAAPRHITPRTVPAIVSPTVITLDASNIWTIQRIPSSGSTLNGNLAFWGTANAVNVSFQWGTASGLYTNETAPQTLSVIGTFSDSLTGLSSNTTYYFRAKANGGIHGTSYGVEKFFTTP